MGNTSIIELNHDFAHEIKDHPDLFVKYVLEQLNSGIHSGGLIPGGQVITYFNRNNSEIDQAWEEFKQKFRDYEGKYARTR